ncbi:MAG: PEP-CTERM sorting domain-containing protein, partial [Candidatus Omnitrophica bacterium]|nr:PEP-CTERM sorting domain-containing protein [Candidatus Omnitrophota bacterium]
GSSGSSDNRFQNSSLGNRHNPVHGNSNGNEVGENDQKDAPQGFYDDQPSFSDDEFPAATTVPEPATLSLVGMGLASLLLKKRKQ